MSIILLSTSLSCKAQPFELTDLKAASGKAYQIKHNGFHVDGNQYIDRDYEFSKVPESLQGKTLIMTAGNDKMYEEHETCFTFYANKDIIVHIIYADKYPVNPVWLDSFEKTNLQVLRKDSSFETMKGVFTVYSKKFTAGEIEIKGCLGKGMKTPEFVESEGSGYCMYSVVVEEAVD